MLETICYKILPETKRCTYYHFVLTTKPKTKRSQTTFIDFGGIIWSKIIKDDKSKHKACPEEYLSNKSVVNVQRRQWVGAKPPGKEKREEGSKTSTAHRGSSP